MNNPLGLRWLPSHNLRHMVDRERLTIEVLGGSNGTQPAILDRVIGGTIDLDEAKRIGRHLVSITEGTPKAFRVLSRANQLLYEWHSLEQPQPEDLLAADEVVRDPSEPLN